MGERVRIEINESRCVRCGACERVCPSAVFHWEEGGITTDHPGRCIGCGHCVGVCPKEAFGHSELPLEKFEAAGVAPHISTEQIEVLFKERRSRRSFDDASLSKEEVERVVDFARYAPTSTNSQNVRFLVFNDRESVRELSEGTSRYYLKLERQLANPFIRFGIGLTVGWKTVNAYRYRMPAIAQMFKKTLSGEDDRLFYNAPTVMVLFASGLPHLASASCNLAAMQIMLGVESMGLGSFFNGYALTALVRDKKTREQFDIPKGYTPGAVLAVGRHSTKMLKVPPRNARRIIWRD